jgi:hypothetical protein
MVDRVVISIPSVPDAVKVDNYASEPVGLSAGTKASVAAFSHSNLPTALTGMQMVKRDAVPRIAGSWKADYTFIGGDVVWDSTTNQYALMYAGYSTTTLSQTIGLAYSTDLLNWVDYSSNPVLSPGIAGSDTYGGGTFPQLVWDGTLWQMFYIGFNGQGFETGATTIQRASAPALTGPWTKQGIVISPQPGTWATGVIYKPHVFQHKGQWFMFTNGGPAAGNESIGYATAPALTGPWTLASTASITTAMTGLSTHSDPEIIRIADVYYMLFWSFGGTYLATTSFSSFPNGWAYQGKVVDNFESSGGPYFAQTTARPVIVPTENGVTLLVCRGGYPTSMDIYQSAQRALPSFKARTTITSGNITITAATWGVTANASPTLVLAAKVGDWVEVGISALYQNDAVNGLLDVASMVSGAAVNAWGENGPENNAHEGVPSWGGTPSAYSHVGGSIIRQVTANDLEKGGQLTLQLRGRTSSGTRVIIANATDPFTMYAINHR